MRDNGISKYEYRISTNDRIMIAHIVFKWIAKIRSFLCRPFSRYNCLIISCERDSVLAPNHRSIYIPFTLPSVKN